MDALSFDPALLRDSYVAILRLGLENLQRYRLPERIEYLAIEIDHLHNVPKYLDQSDVWSHAYYYCATRPLYIERLSSIPVIDTDFIRRQYEPHWLKLREGLNPWAETINSHPNPLWERV